MLAVDTIHQMDCLEGMRSLPNAIVQCCVTSPPYWLHRDYNVKGQYGHEQTPELYVSKLVEVCEEVRRVLKPDGIMWLNIGDGYYGSGKAGRSDAYKVRHTQFGRQVVRPGRLGLPSTGRHPHLKPKDLIGLPWMLAFALRETGWYLRQDVIWHKPSCLPESVRDRCTRAHEYIFLLSKQKRYYFDHQAIKTRAKGKAVRDRTTRIGKRRLPTSMINGIRKGGREYLKANKRSVWVVSTKPSVGGHSAAFPEELIVDCVKAGSREGDLVLDPFMGTGTTAVVAKELDRHFVGFELNPEFIRAARERLLKRFGLFAPEETGIAINPTNFSEDEIKKYQ